MDDVAAAPAAGSGGARELSLRRSFVEGARAMLRSPLKTSLLALACLLAAFSLVIAIGAVLLPWLLSALSAHQLRQQRGGLSVSWRRRLWIVFFEGLGVVVFGVLGGLSMLSWDFPLPGAGDDPGFDRDLEGLWRSPALFVAAALALPVRQVWMWVPTALFDGARGPAEAMARAAHLVERAPAWRARALAAAAPLVPALGVSLGASLTLLGLADGLRRYTVPVFVLVAVVAVALGRGWVTASYLVVARAAGDPGPPPAGTLPRRRWVVPSVLLALGLMLVAAQLAVPRLPGEGRMPEGAEVVAKLGAESNVGSMRLRGTPLRVLANPTGVVVVADDGGGVGRIPLPPESRVEGVVVGRQGDTYWLQIAIQGQVLRRVPFDAQGVRLDDRLTSRLAACCPWPLRLLLAACVVVFGLLLSRDVRREAGLGPAGGPGSSALAARFDALGLWALGLVSLGLGITAALL